MHLWVEHGNVNWIEVTNRSHSSAISAVSIISPDQTRTPPGPSSSSVFLSFLFDGHLLWWPKGKLPLSFNWPYHFRLLTEMDGWLILDQTTSVREGAVETRKENGRVQKQRWAHYLLQVRNLARTESKSKTFTWKLFPPHQRALHCWQLIAAYLNLAYIKKSCGLMSAGLQ